MIQLYWPGSPGEWLAFASAALTALFGLAVLVMPRMTLRAMGSATGSAAAVRGPMGGFLLGTGLCCLAMAQPFLYLGLGAGWLFAAFGRLLSVLLDGTRTARDWVVLLAALALGAMPLAFVLGYVG